MRKFQKPTVAICLAAAILVGGYYAWRIFISEKNPYARGIVIESLDGVPVYDNGPIFTIAHGRNHAPDGYYFGQKWQCVEFIKRYLYTAKNHRMPDVWGHAITFFDPDVAHGARNTRRGMAQYRQGGAEKPRSGDLLVFAGAGGYGHVAIIAAVTDNEIEIVQQNAPPARARLALHAENGGWRVGSGAALGWLRVEG